MNTLTVKGSSIRTNGTAILLTFALLLSPIVSFAGPANNNPGLQHRVEALEMMVQDLLLPYNIRDIKK